MSIGLILSSSGLPAVTAAATLSLFELAERTISPGAKQALTAQIKQFAPERTIALPRGAIELFNRVFGDRQFSWKCIRRSILFSVIANIALCMLVVFLNPNSELRQSTADTFSITIATTILWLPCIAIIDYLNLYKTRSVLSALADRSSSALLLTSILFADFLVGLIVFHTLFALVFQFTEDIVMNPDMVGFLLAQIPSAIWDNFDVAWMARHLLFNDFDSALFYASMLPSIWLWLYIVAMFLTRGLIQMGGMISLARWALDIENAPLRSLGVVAAVLVFAVVLVFSLIRLAAG